MARRAIARFLMGLSFLLPSASLSLAEDHSNPTSQARLMSFKEVVDYALKNYPQIAVSEADIDIAEAGLRIARSERIPILFLRGGYNFFDKPNILLPTTRAGNMSDTRFGDNFVRYDVAMILPLYTGGRIGSQIKLEELTILMSRYRLQQTKDELIFNLASSYYSILGLQEVVKAREKAVENLEETRRIVEQLVNVGRSPKLDLYRVETRLANVRQDLVVAQNALGVTHGVLNTLMGLNVTERVDLTETLQHVPLTTTLDAVIEEALRKRPEYLRLQQEIARQEQQVKMAQAALKPQIGLELNYFGVTAFDDKRPGPQFTGRVRATEALSDWRAGINVTIPIFNRGLRDKVVEERLALNRLQRQLDQLRLDVKLEVQRAYLNILSAEERIRATERALMAAAESLRIEQLKLTAGTGVVNDVLDAEADQLAAEEHHAQALADYQISTYALKKAIGEVTVL